MDYTTISVPMEDHKVERIVLNADGLMQTQTAVVAHQMAVTEVPAMIAVETIFITHQLARQKKIHLSQTLVLSEAYVDSDSENENDADIYLYQTQDIGVMAQPEVEDFAVQTDGPNPQRDREIQTIKLTYQKDIGIQCEWETDTFIDEIKPQGDVHKGDGDPLNCDDISNSKCYAEFLEFVQESTYMYDDNKTECMKCGEVCKNPKQALAHMAMHWGPSMLCERCGQCLEHARLLTLHQCGFGPPNKNTRKQFALSQCPLYACGLMLKSNIKLLNHLEHHVNLAFYQRLTPAAQSKLRFTKRIAKGQKPAGKRALRGSVSDTLRCQICLMRSTCTTVFVRHRKKCIKRFIQRLKVMKHKITSQIADNPF